MPPELKAITRLDCTVQHSTSVDRPDLVLVDEYHKRATMADVTISFNDGPRSMEEVRQGKIVKCSGIAKELAAQGYQVVNEALAPSHREILWRLLGINGNYAKLIDFK